MAKIATVSTDWYGKGLSFKEKLACRSFEVARRIIRVGEAEEVLNYGILVKDFYKAHGSLAVEAGVCNFWSEFFYYTFECAPGGLLFEKYDSTENTLYLAPDKSACEVPAPEIKSAAWSRPVGDVFKDVPLGTYINLQYPALSSYRLEEGRLVAFADKSVTLRSKTYGKDNVFYFGNLEVITFPEE